MHTHDRPLSAPAATGLAFAAAGALTASIWLSSRWIPEAWSAGLPAGSSLPWSVRFEAAAFDSAHFLAAGLGVSALLRAARWLEQRTPWLARGDDWRRRGILLATAYAASAALGAMLLPVDLANFSQRQAWVPPVVAQTLGIVIVSAAVPAGVALGWALRHRPGRMAASCGLLAASWMNAALLPNDYFAIHLFFGLGALAVTASAWTCARPSQIPGGWVRTAGLGLAAAAAVLGLVLPPSARASSALATSTGSIITRWIAATQHVLAPDRSVLSAPDENPWMTSRTAAADIPPSTPPLLGPEPLVILLTVDALRADVVNSGKYDDRLPHLAALRRRAVWFSNARASGTLTKIAVSGLMLGTYFSQQYWVDKGPYRSIADDTTLRFPALLQRANVRTINYRSIGWLRNGNVLGGFDEDVFVKSPKHKYTPTAPLFDKLLPRLTALDAKATFVYSHLSDPHAPYDLAVKKGSQFERYLAEVGLVDTQLGRLLDLLERENLATRTLLILSADHGEAFGEHNSRTHGTTLYDEQLRVPLLFVFPQAAPRRIEDLVTLLDVGPTVLDIFGQATPAAMMGQSLVPYLSGETPELSRPILAETRLMQAWITHDHKKLIVDTRTGRKELYDLKNDPKELHNLADDAEALARPLADLERFIEAHRLKKPGYKPPFVR